MIASAHEILSGYCGSDDRLLLAVSGGADSLSMLLQLSRDASFQSRIVCATVDHGLRSSSAQDVEYVRAVCVRERIPFVTMGVDTRKEMQSGKLSLEAAARQTRYRALERLRVESGCEWIVTAHSLEDDAETVLMKLRANSAWYECTGIPLRRGRILRPFLDTRREELRRMLSECDVIKAREDEHNFDVRFPRVAVRHWLDGMAKAEREGVVKKAAEAGRQVRRLLVISSRLLKCVPQVMNKQQDASEDGIDIDLEICYLHDLRFLAIEASVGVLRETSDFRLRSASRRRAMEFASGTLDRAQLELPDGVELKREGRRLRVIATQRRKRVVGSSQGFGFDVSGQRIVGSAIVREWRAGERFKPAFRRTRKVADWLRDCGVPSDIRPHVKVVCDDLGVIAVPGLGVAERVFPRAGEERLRVICAD